MTEIERKGCVLDAIVDLCAEDMPTKEEADEELRAMGLDPEKVGRELRERLEVHCTARR